MISNEFEIKNDKKYTLHIFLSKKTPIMVVKTMIFQL